ncbi:MAG: hypothetical protein CME68_04390 [Halobacteriovoraceae bacterium]|nr:hypothetical protein [Halobacteriovoraceae bacterium]
MEKCIDVQNLSFSYLSQKILHNCSLSLDKGRFCALIGENGAGKSTFLKNIAGLEIPDQGNIQFLGEKLSNDSIIQKSKLIFITENLSFSSPLTIKKFIRSFKKLYPLWSQEVFDSIVKQRGINLEKRFNDYSRGQKMQILLASYLSTGPKLILIDEVTSVLDIHAQKDFMKIFYNLVKAGSTVILATNILSEVAPYATDLCFIENGHIKFNVPVNDLKRKYIRIKTDKKIEKAYGIELIEEREDQFYYIGLNESLTSSIKNNSSFKIGPPSFEELFLFFSKGKRELEP